MLDEASGPVAWCAAVPVRALLADGLHESENLVVVLASEDWVGSMAEASSAWRDAVER